MQKDVVSELVKSISNLLNGERFSKTPSHSPTGKITKDAACIISHSVSCFVFTVHKFL